MVTVRMCARCRTSLTQRVTDALAVLGALRRPILWQLRMRPDGHPESSCRIERSLTRASIRITMVLHKSLSATTRGGGICHAVCNQRPYALTGLGPRRAGHCAWSAVDAVGWCGQRGSAQRRGIYGRKRERRAGQGGRSTPITVLILVRVHYWGVLCSGSPPPAKTNHWRTLREL